MRDAVNVENSGTTKRNRTDRRRESAVAALRFTAERSEVNEPVSVEVGRKWRGRAKKDLRNGRYRVQRHGEGEE